jgi:hypothetical protein
MKKIKFRSLTKSGSLNLNHPVPAIRFLPEWYKNIEPYIGQKRLSIPSAHGMPNVTIKRCVPFLDAMTAGYMVYLTDDIFVEKTIDGPQNINWRHTEPMLSHHSLEQFKGIAIPENYNQYVWKWNNDWSINVPEGYSIYFTHPSNRFDLPFKVISGIVDCDTFDLSVQFPFLLDKDFEGIIEAGTPICQLIPFKREEWETEVLDYDEEKTYLIHRKFFKTFVSSYKKMYWHKKSYN